MTKYARLWPMLFILPLLGALTAAIYRAGHQFVAFALGIFFVIRSFQLAIAFLRMQPEEIEASNATQREIWIVLPIAVLASVAISVGATYFLGRASHSDPQITAFVTLSVLIPATVYVLVRAMIRSWKAKRAAAERIALKQESE
jgi:uncharacterized membrane protein